MRLKVILLATAAVAAPAIAFAQTPPAPKPQPAADAPARKPPADATSVQDVTVTGQRNGFRSSIDRRSYSVADDLGATNGSIGDALRNVPSVEVDVQGNISLRGDANVTILVDGRPSGMFKGDGKADALQQMPADQIDRVEVMTNPSAAFSPEGTAGVINLVTKKGKKSGRSGSVRANVGTDGRYNGGVSGSVMSGKLGLSGDAGVRHDVMDGETSTDRSRFDVGSGQFIDSRQRAKSDGTGDGRNLRGNLDYDLDAATRVSAEIRHRGMKFSNDSLESYEGEDSTGAVVTTYDRAASSSMERSNTEASASWRRKFKGDEHELVADLSFERTEGDRRMRALQTGTLPGGANPYEATHNEIVQDETQFKLDYTRPVGDQAKLKTGLQIERSENDYDNQGLRGLDAGSATVDTSRTNRFLYDQTVQAAYATYERPLGPVTALVGLRLEQVDIDMNQVTTGVTATNDYSGVYPSLHLAYDLTDSQQLTASYSKRVQRPQAQDLNPYVVYVDPFNLRSGNPNLKPQETDSYELGWQYRSGQTFYLATAYYRQSTDGVTEVVRACTTVPTLCDPSGTLDLDGVFLTTRENLAESRSGGLELVANGRLTKSLTYNLSSNAYWQEIEGSTVTATDGRSGWSVGGRGALNWQATPKDFIQINAFVMGKRLQAQGWREPTGMLNLGYRHKVDEKLSVVLTAQDVLGTMRDRLVIDTPTIHDRTERQMNARGVFLGLTYTFGDGGKRQRDPGFDFGAGADTGGGG
ncbi:TonB-dependent receptor [Caulobacter sp. 17J65-9]|uniref:TonB-dependent receptor domain-containing protein n=1 Tax=Caulobacter sp. 17J65-9 TaxID=2709382 RepID=UPI0013C55E0F|nr:TonB-dependent receptor [Caulobacter sp. 17J65-9]NEX91750.1 TonB-dependent receptor [Caulobacter sp. 17J65-9]